MEVQQEMNSDSGAEETILVKEEEEKKELPNEQNEEESDEEYEIVSTPLQRVRGPLNYITPCLTDMWIDGDQIAFKPRTRVFRKCSKPAALKGKY